MSKTLARLRKKKKRKGEESNPQFSENMNPRGWQGQSFPINNSFSFPSFNFQEQWRLYLKASHFFSHPQDTQQFEIKSVKGWPLYLKRSLTSFVQVRRPSSSFFTWDFCIFFLTVRNLRSLIYFSCKNLYVIFLCIL